MDNKDQTNKNRMILLLIAGIPVTMILGATWLWYFVVRGDLDLVGTLGTANRGELVQPPRQIDELALTDQNASRFHYVELEPRWTMLVPVAGADCDASCENKLYVTRQIHMALGKEINRMRRLYVSDSGTADSRLTTQQLSDGRPLAADFPAYLANEHRGLAPLVLPAGDFQRFFPEYLAEPGTWYLVDPAGWIMMSYTLDTSYKDVIADLKFLLKNSSE